MILVGDVLEQLATLPAESVHCCVTSPPYWGLRDYGVQGQIGLEPTPEEWLDKMVAVFREVRRVLRDDATCWVNVGDSYANDGKWGGQTGGKHVSALHGEPIGRSRRRTDLKPKDLCLIPERLALRLQEDGWWVRSRIAWCKKSAMPESVTDRPTSAWEHVWLLSKSARYFYDAEAVKYPSPNAGQTRITTAKSFARSAAGLGISPSGNAIPGSVVEIASHANLRNWWLLGPEPFSWRGQSARQVRAVSGEPSDGTTRITSPSCPVHGVNPALPPTAPDGERGGDASSRTSGNGSGPAPMPLFDSAPTAQPHDAETRGGSLDCSDPSRSPTATDRSTETRKTGRVPGSTSPCNASAESPGRTGRTSTSPDETAPSGHSPESNTAEPSSCQDDGSAQTQPHTTDMSPSDPPRLKCTCRHVEEIYQETDHFATFPTEIPRRAIKAGTSAKGACASCGAPWERVVERESVPRLEGKSSSVPSDSRPLKGSLPAHLRTDESKSGFGTGKATTTGWTPTCSCDAEVVPCTVLDPFSGAGTTGVVCVELDRRYIGIELNPEYAAMSEDRISKQGAPQMGLAL